MTDFDMMAFLVCVTIGITLINIGCVGLCLKLTTEIWKIRELTREE